MIRIVLVLAVPAALLSACHPPDAGDSRAAPPSPAEQAAMSNAATMADTAQASDAGLRNVH